MAKCRKSSSEIFCVTTGSKLVAAIALIIVGVGIIERPLLNRIVGSSNWAMILIIASILALVLVYMAAKRGESIFTYIANILSKDEAEERPEHARRRVPKFEPDEVLAGENAKRRRVPKFEPPAEEETQVVHMRRRSRVAEPEQVTTDEGTKMVKLPDTNPGEFVIIYPDSGETNVIALPTDLDGAEVALVDPYTSKVYVVDLEEFVTE